MSGKSYMDELSADEAIDRARKSLDIPAQVTARAFRVRRLDRPQAGYYLVLFGEDDATIGVATLDAGSGEAMSSAQLPGRGPHISINQAQAVDLAGMGKDAHAEMVWKPCRATRSLLYPLWEIHDGTKTVFVDQQGTVWQELEEVDSRG